ncbi:MAG: hypothetical protein ACFE94_16910 [Candidatus Hodarchaeota archaeon]
MPETKEKLLNRKVLIIRLLILISYLLILLFFFYFLTKFGANPFIVLILLLFTFLITIGPFFRRGKRSLYSRMFPNRKRKSSLEGGQKEKDRRIKRKFEQAEPKIYKKVNLEINYRKPIVLKCGNCGNTIPNFVKKCPFCNKQVSY